MTILIISSVKASTEIYDAIPAKKGCIVECNLSEAKDFVSRCHADLVLLDCGAEVKKGMELLEQLKMTHPCVPVVFVTDISSKDIVLKAFKTGAMDYFKKPFDALELGDTIRGILGVKKNAKEIRKPFKGIMSARLNIPEEISRFRDLSETLCYIKKNLSAEIKLQNFAEQAHLSKSGFCKRFKRQTGQSFSKFVTAMRIEKAKELFLRSNLSVSMVAINVGFNGNVIFAKHFKENTGMTPSTYKKSLKMKHINE